MSDFETIIYSKEGAIAGITLNRPNRLNVYNIKMRDELFQTFEAIRDDGDVRVVLLSGSGRAFCAGADLTEFLTAPPPAAARQARFDRDVWGLMLSLRQPLVAAVHGYVFGSGLEMALCCDIRIASEDAQFAFPETALGIIPAAGGTQTLPRTIGRAKSLEMLLAGTRLAAGEARKLGLVSRVVPEKELLAEARQTAERFACADSFVIGFAKASVVAGMNMPLGPAVELERRLALLSCERYCERWAS